MTRIIDWNIGGVRRLATHTKSCARPRTRRDHVTFPLGRLFSAALAAGLVAGCTSAPTPDSQPELALAAPSDTAPPPSAAPSGSCLPDCPGSRSYDARAYALRARFDWTQSRLHASEEITLALTDPAAAVVELD